MQFFVCLVLQMPEWAGKAVHGTGNSGRRSMTTDQDYVQAARLSHTVTSTSYAAKIFADSPGPLPSLDIIFRDLNKLIIS